MALLDQIEGPNDIKKLQQNEWDALAEEIRRFLVRNVSMTGGHLASNLGVVELTMALHLALDLPNDKIVWDVGHQSYTHKILTGRKDGVMKLRQYGGISGFPKRAESECDVYDSGHSSTSISAALGMAHARDLLEEVLDAARQIRQEYLRPSPGGKKYLSDQMPEGIREMLEKAERTQEGSGDPD